MEFFTLALKQKGLIKTLIWCLHSLSNTVKMKIEQRTFVSLSLMFKCY